ncbi:MAG: hypothetical protein P4N60_19100, partial [Verrucomicrobiae bacterium]|nr:hypothetical protein [Verrucomicrobiae bacterium]
MKTKIILLLISLVIFATSAFSQRVYFVDTTTLTTNSTSGGGYLITIPGFCTNAYFTTQNTNNIITGDFLPVAFGKLNTNGITLSNLLVVVVTNGGTGYQLSGTFTNSILTHSLITNSAITNSSLAGNGQYVTAINGANLTTGTVNSNQLDAATLTWLGTLGGGSANFIASPLAITAPNGELYLTAGTNSFNGYGQVADFTSWDTTNNVGRGLQFQGYGGGSGGQFPVNFIGHGGDGDNVSVKFL